MGFFKFYGSNRSNYAPPKPLPARAEGVEPTPLAVDPTSFSATPSYSPPLGASRTPPSRTARSVPQEPFLPAQDPSQISAPPNRSGPPEQPLPGSGEGVFSFDRSACWSQLNIVPRAYQGHLVVKVEDWNSSVLVCWFFIREGQSAETPIPAGSCRLIL